MPLTIDYVRRDSGELDEHNPRKLVLKFREKGMIDDTYHSLLVAI